MAPLARPPPLLLAAAWLLLAQGCVAQMYAGDEDVGGMDQLNEEQEEEKACLCEDDLRWENGNNPVVVGWGRCASYAEGGYNEGKCVEHQADVHCPVACDSCPKCTPQAPALLLQMGIPLIALCTCIPALRWACSSSNGTTVVEQGDKTRKPYWNVPAWEARWIAIHQWDPRWFYPSLCCNALEICRKPWPYVLRCKTCAWYMLARARRERRAWEKDTAARAAEAKMRSELLAHFDTDKTGALDHEKYQQFDTARALATDPTLTEAQLTESAMTKAAFEELCQKHEESADKGITCLHHAFGSNSAMLHKMHQRCVLGIQPEPGAEPGLGPEPEEEQKQGCCKRRRNILLEPEPEQVPTQTQHDLEIGEHHPGDVPQPADTFATVDTDGTGLITFSQFLTAMRALRSSMTEDQLFDMFVRGFRPESNGAPRWFNNRSAHPASAPCQRCRVAGKDCYHLQDQRGEPIGEAIAREQTTTAREWWTAKIGGAEAETKVKTLADTLAAWMVKRGHPLTAAHRMSHLVIDKMGWIPPASPRRGRGSAKRESREDRDARELQLKKDTEVRLEHFCTFVELHIGKSFDESDASYKARLLNQRPPLRMDWEIFLDDQGEGGLGGPIMHNWPMQRF